MAATPPKAGKYELVYLSENGSLTYGIVKITPNEGGVSGELVYANPRAITGLKSVALDGDVLRVTVEQGAGSERVFEGRVAQPGTDTVLGSFGPFAWGLVPARLSFTDQDKPTSNELVREPHPELMQKAEALAPKGDAEAPKLYCEVLEKHPGTRAAWTAAAKLIQQAGRTKDDPTEVARWAALVVKHAAPYGPRYEAYICLRLAEQLARRSVHARMAAEYARRAESAVPTKASLEEQIRSLEPIAAVYRSAGHAADAARTDTRLAALNADMDRDYLAKMPPFKPTAFAGRQARSDRVAVMELFTGAQCPPCVAADLAFDGLLRTYKPTDVVLLQYHVDIPGPDPLTNPATEARMAYYRKLSPGGLGGAPAAVFNGQPQAGGGGSVQASEKKYKEYRTILDGLLEQPAGAAVHLGATRSGDTITFQAGVSKLKNPGEDKKLRLLLVEESIRFVGSNKIRFHHMVVRAMPGGPNGMALTQKESKHTASVNLAQLREELTKYLDDYAATKRPFPQPGRPLDFKGLKAIALVQDDKTGEILQAAITDVGNDRAAR
jgi:hypothetical protein